MLRALPKPHFHGAADGRHHKPACGFLPDWHAIPSPNADFGLFRIEHALIAVFCGLLDAFA